MEKQYWNYVENQIGPKIKVQYAADLAVTTYGSGFGRRDSEQYFEPRIEKQLDHPWNLNNFYKNDNSLMQFPGSNDLSGVNIPWLYIGMKFSTFCWHYEDLMLNSLNYNHWGKPKVWYGVPEDYREKFEKAIKSKCALLFKKDPNILLDIITMVSPAYLLSQKIKMYKTLQYPGEFILTFPGAYHSGFSTGLNVGEAVNFVTRSWFPYGRKCETVYRKSREKIPVFPLEWLLLGNIVHRAKVVLDKATRTRIREVYARVVDEEKERRERVERRTGRKGEVMGERDGVPYDSHPCQFCTDFAFLSVVQCRQCEVNYCLKHECGCEKTQLQVVYRYTTVELEGYLRDIQRAAD